MKKFIVFFSLFIFCSQAEAKFYPAIKNLDRSGVAVSSDITTACSNNFVFAYDTATSAWICEAQSGAAGAPSDAQYLVSVADGTLSAEDVVSEGMGIDYTNSVGLGTLSLDLTEVSGDQTIGPGTDLNKTLTFDLSGTDVGLHATSGRIGTGGDFSISGDDLFMATNTDRLTLIADGTNYNPEAIDLGTDTTGNYAAGDAEAGAATTGDSATSFFSTGTIEGARLGEMSKSFVITGVTASGDFGTVWRSDVAITIVGVHVLAVGGTNVVGHLDECDANGGTCAGVDGATDITATTGTNANDDGSLSNPSIDAGDWIGWHTTSVSGTNTRVAVTFEYTVN